MDLHFTMLIDRPFSHQVNPAGSGPAIRSIRCAGAGPRRGGREGGDSAAGQQQPVIRSLLSLKGTE